MNNRTYVLYHANCADGFASAWVAHRRFADTADYLPVQYGQDPPDVEGRDVFILDFSYKKDVLRMMTEKANSIVILDHHRTAKADLAEFAAPNASITFDMTKSGGRLTWDFFHPGEPSPWLVDYTEDRDLWAWKLDNSREINAALASYPRTFSFWDEIGSKYITWGAKLAQEGGAIGRYSDQLVRSICNSAREIDIDGHKILAANTSVLFSEVAGELAKDRPFGAAWFIRSDGMKQWSLRSSDEGLDVSEVAKRHGGGGHRNASGYQEIFYS